MLTTAIQILLSSDMFVKIYKLKIIRVNSIRWLSRHFKYSCAVSKFDKICPACGQHAFHT